MRDGFGRRRFSARSRTDDSRRIFLFFDDSVLLCFAYVDTLSALECFVQRMCCTAVCCHSIVFCNSVSADRSGVAALRFIVAAPACVSVLQLRVVNVTSSSSGN